MSLQEARLLFKAVAPTVTAAAVASPAVIDFSLLRAARSLFGKLVPSGCGIFVVPTTVQTQLSTIAITEAAESVPFFKPVLEWIVGIGGTVVQWVRMVGAFLTTPFGAAVGSVACIVVIGGVWYCLHKHEEPKLHLAPPDVSSSSIGSQQSVHICPITQEPIVVPVAAPDGRVYEDAAIRLWLSQHPISPFTRQPMQETQLYRLYMDTV